MKRLYLGFAAALLSFPALAGAQAQPTKGEIVYLKVPVNLLQTKQSIWSGVSLTMAVEPAGESASVNGETGWATLGFPPLTEFKVNKVKASAMSGALPSGPTEIEVKKTLGDATIKLSFPKGEPGKLFPMIFASKGEVESYRAATYKALAGKFFDGTPLAALSEEKKNRLVLFAHMTAHGTTMGSTTYKDNLYLRIDLGSDDNVYNELRMNQAQRVARVLNDNLLTVLKAFAQPVADVNEVYGLKLEMEIPHKSFADQTAVAQRDKLEIYAPSDLVKKFSDADITSQQFIDGCVVIVNANRVSIPLSS